MTLAGGFLFGVTIGSTLTVIGATLGATALFLIARTALGDVLRKKAGPFLARMADGFNKDAFNYLLFLRLVPVFPFWVVNLVPPLLGMRLIPFVVATGLGIIPATIVFSAFSAGLGRAPARICGKRETDLAHEVVIGSLHGRTTGGPFRRSLAQSRSGLPRSIENPASKRFGESTVIGSTGRHGALSFPKTISGDLAPLPPFPSWLDCTTNTVSPRLGLRREQSKAYGSSHSVKREQIFH